MQIVVPACVSQCSSSSSCPLVCFLGCLLGCLCLTPFTVPCNPGPVCTSVHSWLRFWFTACSWNGGVMFRFSSTYMCMFSSLPFSSGCSAGFLGFAPPFTKVGQDDRVSLLLGTQAVLHVHSWGSDWKWDLHTDIIRIPAEGWLEKQLLLYVSTVFAPSFAEKVWVNISISLAVATSTPSLLRVAHTALISLLIAAAAVNLRSWCSALASWLSYWEHLRVSERGRSRRSPCLAGADGLLHSEAMLLVPAVLAVPGRRLLRLRGQAGGVQLAVSVPEGWADAAKRPLRSTEASLYLLNNYDCPFSDIKSEPFALYLFCLPLSLLVW